MKTKKLVKDPMSFDSIMDRANVLYASEKVKHYPKETILHMAPEMFPSIRTDQVKCMLRALLEAMKKKEDMKKP